MRIVQVSPFSWDVPGGVQAHVRQLTAHLESRGHDVTVLAPGKQPFEREGVRIVGRAVPVPSNGSVARICFSPQSAREVERVLRVIRPDIIHVHEPVAPSTGMFAVQRANAPVVATFHSNVPEDWPQGLMYRMAVPLVRPVWNRIDHRLAVSSAARDSVQARLGGLPIEILPNGIDVQRFAAAAPARLRPGRHLLFVGRLEPRKGFPVIVRAFAHLARRHRDLRLLVVGAGDDDALDELPEAVRSRVEMLGRVPDSRLPGLYQAADLFVSPALGGESFGIVLVEAMAAGLPVVASDIDGYRDVVRHGREALLVPPGDDVALADAIERLLGDPGLAGSLGTRGSRRALEFDWAAIGDRLEEIYVGLTRRRRRVASRVLAEA
jgi:phosphatidylinositol alpha-mannosyltransferase